MVEELQFNFIAIHIPWYHLESYDDRDQIVFFSIKIYNNPQIFK